MVTSARAAPGLAASVRKRANRSWNSSSSVFEGAQTV
jgi:hypothetical protein